MTWQNQQNGCAPSEDSGSAWASAQSDQSLRCPHKAWVLSYPLSAQRRLIRLGGCPGWSESSLSALSFCWFCHVVSHMLRNHLDINSFAWPEDCKNLKKFGHQKKNRCNYHTKRAWSWTTLFVARPVCPKTWDHTVWFNAQSWEIEWIG